MKEFDREVQKRYERMGKLKADVSAMPKPFTIAVYALTIIAILGLCISLFYGSTALGKISIWVAFGGAVGDILLYSMVSVKGPVRYNEVMIKHQGVYLLFQVISDNHVIFSEGNYCLEYKKKQVTEREGILNPELSYSAPLSAEYTSSEIKGAKMVYTGEKTVGEKKMVYKVTCEGKFATGFKANGRSVLFDCINKKDAGLAIPAALAAEITKRGTTLPSDEIFISNK